MKRQDRPFPGLLGAAAGQPDIDLTRYARTFFLKIGCALGIGAGETKRCFSAYTPFMKPKETAQ